MDDWAWRRGRRYGTILVDLEYRRMADFLPHRRADTLATWLTAHPGAEVISRDRGGTYADATRRGAPAAVQVSDHWYLQENCGSALLHAARRRRREVRSAAQEDTIEIVTTAAR